MVDSQYKVHVSPVLYVNEWALLCSELRITMEQKHVQIHATLVECALKGLRAALTRETTDRIVRERYAKAVQRIRKGLDSMPVDRGLQE